MSEHILRTYLGDQSVPEHYQAYIHDVISHPSGWIKTKVVGADFYEPEATHHMYYDFDTLPPFAHVESQVRYRMQRFIDNGYVAIAGVLAVGGMPTRRAVTLHERGAVLLQRGCLLGPYFLGGTYVSGGFQFYEQS